MIRIFVLTCMFVISMNLACATSYKEQQADLMIVKLYQSIPHEKILADRIDWMSSKFLGKPYLLGALGEGSRARYDQYPRYRTDAFDCLTYVNTVLALAFAGDLASFKTWMAKINYQHGKYAFLERNHFLEIARRPRLHDITAHFVNAQGVLVAQRSETWINQPGWYSRLPPQQIRLLSGNSKIRTARWLELKDKGQKLSKQRVIIRYLPLSELFDSNLQPVEFLFAQIPNLAILEIVRPNWRLRDIIGTDLMVSHLGFVLRTTHGLVFREASSIDGVVEDVSLVDYLRASMASPTIKGVRILELANSLK